MSEPKGAVGDLPPVRQKDCGTQRWGLESRCSAQVVPWMGTGTGRPRGGSSLQGGEDMAIEFAKLTLCFLCEISFALSSPPVGPGEKV